jgi:hypothetical protein
MQFSTFLKEHATSEIVRAFTDTVKYCAETQKGELQTRDGINYLVGRLKDSDPQLAAALDEILKSTK